MKVVHLSTFTAQGGAGIATLRIHKKLLEQGIDSNLIVFKPSGSTSPGVTEVKKGLLYRAREFLFYRLEKHFFRSKIRPGSQQFSFNYFRRISIKRNPLIKQADIVCLYWVGSNFLTPEQIGEIDKPIVWRLSDKWPFTGGCHYSNDCKRYEEHCGSCPQLITNEKKDFTWVQWKRKNKSWRNKNITLVAPSRWIADAAARSSLFRDRPIVRVGTGIDHTIFKPTDKKQAREALNIPVDAKVIVFGAHYALEVSNKGGIFFRQMIEQLTEKGYIFILFGSDKKNHIDDIYKKVRFLGLLRDEKDIQQVYSAADIFICPSTEDNLPNTVLESMACGTPCIAFRDSGGVVDVIDHKENGYLAEFKNVDDLVNGIVWISEANNDGKISEKARAKILNEFTLEKQVDSLLALYKSIVNK